MRRVAAIVVLAFAGGLVFGGMCRIGGWHCLAFVLAFVVAGVVVAAAVAWAVDVLSGGGK